MHGDTQLIATIAISLAAALAGGLIAARLGLPTIVGYLLAGRRRRPVHPWLRGRCRSSPSARRDRRHPADVRGGHPLLPVGTCWRSAASCSRARSVRSSSRPLLGTLLGVLMGWTPGEAHRPRARRLGGEHRRARARPDGARRAPVAGRGASPWAGSSSRTSSWSSCSCCCRASRSSRARGAGRRPRDCRRGVAFALARQARCVPLMLVVGARVVPRLLGFVARLRDSELFTLAVLADRLGDRLRRGGGLRRLPGAGSVPGRRARERIGPQPPGSRRCAATARGVLGAVLRLGRHAIRPSHCWPASRP